MNAEPALSVQDDTVTLTAIQEAAQRLKNIAVRTPLLKNHNLSERYNANIYIKREDLQVVRSYKLRGAYNKMRSLSDAELARGVVCASAGNHAQGVAYACRKLGVQGTIFMPVPTPQQKVRQVENYGKSSVKIVLIGDTFDDAYQQARLFGEQNEAAFIHPFDDHKVMEGQGTVGLEILEDIDTPIDLMVMPVGGGGLASGVSSCFRALSPATRLVGVEPSGAAAMKASLEAGQNLTLDEIDTFVDGAAVRRVGENTFRVCQQLLDEVIAVPEGQVCSTILSLYNEEAIVAEPAGALSIAALESLKDQIEGKTVVCVLSGGNNDITRTEEIKERSLLHEGLKHYFIVNFPQRAGALKEFVVEVLGPDDNITHFAYTKKNSRAQAPALIGIEVLNRDNLSALMTNMGQKKLQYQYLNEESDLFHYLV
ncbi:threonine dehydratase [Oleiphilus messinensis]|uniref:L-threonine dehydratase n=1 Tax=Oleiphilus messinensis TaxID=141451 RepID=A0A1Y0I4N9_9GAMM|nr:threonine ammonia-lyase IlvA [Oleiphilus messinensis]ARU55200.1 threonine dehydratase [Oleiphilus messinensis]